MHVFVNKTTEIDIEIEIEIFISDNIDKTTGQEIMNSDIDMYNSLISFLFINS